VNLLHFLLNGAGLVLWLCWRPSGLEPTGGWRRGGALGGPSVPPGWRWAFLPALAGLLVGRGWLYWQLGRDVDWVASLDLGAVRLDFHSGRLGRMWAFSLVSFALFLGGYFAWLLFLAAVNRSAAPAHPWQRWISAQLGLLSRLPRPVGLLLPSLALGGAWAAGHALLVDAGLAAPVRHTAHLAQQACVVGLGAVLVWEPLVLGVLLLHLLNSHLYLGNHELLSAVSLTGRQLLRPLAHLSLRTRRLDFTPVAGVILALIGFAVIRGGLVRLFHRLPL
jgi:hypothetical protein